jgi:ferredoxin-NADP reductase
MKVNVKGHIRDLLAFRGLVPKRQKRIAKAPPLILGLDPMNKLARQLHPPLQHLRIASIRDETDTTKTFRLVADREAGTEELALFRAGQYLSLKVEVEGSRITRPYSISSAPSEALGADGFYDLTVKGDPEGFLTPHMWRSWQVGTPVRASGPCGFFYHEPLRDASSIVGLAGGSGITPFRSMARAIAAGEMDAELLILYGSADENDILFYEEFQELERRTADKVRVVHVLSCDEVSLSGCELGFITADVIRRHAALDRCSFFVCGPQAMYRFVEKELAALDLPPRRIRREVRGEVKDVISSPGYPQELAGETFRITARIGGVSTEVEARATETVLVALERANLAPPSQCRSGECGFCRALLVSGDVYVYPENDGRRAADKQFGYIHPCSSYPVTDLEIVVPRDL